MIRDYDISIKNIGKETINDAHVIYGDFYSVGGILPSGITSVHMDPQYPIPEKAIVQWRSKDNVLHKKEVMVKKLIPKDFNGEIMFEIGNDNKVRVVAIPQ